MAPNSNILLLTCFPVLMFICTSRQEESFLTWNFTNTTINEGTELYFTRDIFKKFYRECLCDQGSISCELFIHNMSSLKFNGRRVHVREPSTTITRYVLFLDIERLTITLTKVNSTDNEICTTTHGCARYSVNEKLLNITCDLPCVEIIPSGHVTLTATYNDAVTIDACTLGCSVDTQQQCLIPGTSIAPLYHRTSISSSSSPSSSSSATLLLSSLLPSSSSSSPSSHSSGLTEEHIIIIGLAAGLVIVIASLIILGVIIWRRRQNARERVLSKDTTARTFTNNNDNGIVNYGGDYASADDTIHPYSTSQTTWVPDFETRRMTNHYSTTDPESELQSFTKTSVKSKDENSLEVANSTIKDYIPSYSENPYSEPETENASHASSDTNADPSERIIAKALGESLVRKSPKSDGSKTQYSPSALKNQYSKPETNDVTEAYAVNNPNTKLKKSKNAANMEEADPDTPIDDLKVLYQTPSFKYGNSNLNVNSCSPDNGCSLSKDVDKGMPGSSKLYYASTDIVNSDFNSDPTKPQDTHEYFILERNYESGASSESEDV